MPKSSTRKQKHTGPTKPKTFTVDKDGPRKKHTGVLLAYMHGGNVRGEFASSLFNTSRAFPDLIIGQVSRQSGPRVATTRNNLVREFLLTSAEWMLCIDTDQYWQPEDLKRLFDAADPIRKPIIGGLVFADQAGQLFPTMYKLGPEGHFHVALSYPRDKIVEVDGTGAAFLLIHRRVLERMATKYPEPHPWFQESVVNGHDRGEDLTFCSRVRDLGYKIWVHTGVKVGHVKSRYLTEEEYDRTNDQHHFLIVGTGRSGTGFAASLFSRTLIPTGHEVVFNPKSIAARAQYPTTGQTEWDAFRGEASWLAVPFLPLNVPTVQLVRNPLEVLRSLVGIGFLARTNPGHAPYEEFACESLGWDELGPTEDRAEIISRNVLFMHEWSAMIEEHNDIPRFRVEDLSDLDVINEMTKHLIGKYMDRAKIDAALQETATDVNTRTRDETITWDEGGPMLKVLAERWGYDVAT